VLEQSRVLSDGVRALGCQIEAPFHAMGFLALSVIPSLKITDQGLVDVDQFRLVSLAAGG
jgi:adenine deaminase